jgi:hypothetical protein
MMSFDAGTVKHPTRETALAPRDDAGIRAGRAGASDEVIRRRLLVPRPYYTVTVQRVDRPSAEHHSSIGQPGGPLDPEIGEDV